MGCISYNNIQDSIKNAPWVGATIDGENDYLFGLSGYGIKATKNQVYGTVLYNADSCTMEFCDVCQKARKLVLGCLVTGLLFGFLSFICSMNRVFHDSSTWKTMGIITAMTCFAFGCAAYNLHRPCYLEIERSLETEVIALETATPGSDYPWSFGYGSGAKQVLVAFVFAIYIAFFNLFIPTSTLADDLK